MKKIKSQLHYERDKNYARRKILAWSDATKAQYIKLFKEDVTYSEIRRRMGISVVQAREAWGVLGLEERPLNNINKRAATKRANAKTTYRSTENPSWSKRIGAEMIASIGTCDKGEMHDRIVAALGNRYKATKERIMLDGREVGLYDAILEANRVNKANGMPLIDDNPAWIEGL